MKSKLIPVIVLAAMGASTNAAAQSCDYQGFYVGVNAGVANFFGNTDNAIEASYRDRDNHESLVFGEKRKASSNKGTFGLLLGYSWLFCDQFFLGAELGGAYSKGDLSGRVANEFERRTEEHRYVTTLEGSARAHTRKWEWTADLTPGVVLCDSFLLFGRIGVAANRVKLCSENSWDYSRARIEGEDEHARVGHATAENGRSKNKGALRLGLGLAHYISDCLVLNANYVYTTYGSTCGFGTADTQVRRVREDDNAAVAAEERKRDVTRDGLKAASRAKVHKQTVTVGLNYYFGSMF